MKLLSFKLKRSHGYALLMVMTIVGCAALVAGSTLKRTYNVSSLNQRAKQYQTSMYAAEAAVEKVYARFRYDYLTGGDSAITNNLSIYRTNYPLSTENSHWANYQFWNAQGVNNQTYVGLASNKLYQVLDGNYAGLSGFRATYRVISNARPTTGMHQVGAGVMQDISVDTIPAFQYAIFYNGQLEFTQCAPLDVRGRTHANGPICLGAASGNQLKFWGTVTSTSSILFSNMAGYSGFATPVYAGTPANTIGVPTLNLPIGTNNTAAAVREIIKMPPAGEAASSAMGQQRYFDKAAVVILVSNTTVTLTVKSIGSLGTGIDGTSTPYSFNSVTNGSDLERTNLAVAMPFLNLTNTFYDYRESKWVKATQIDMAKLKAWLPTNSIVTNRFALGSGTQPNILYVNDFRSSTNLNAVRLANGSIIPTNAAPNGAATGLTVATENPLYVWGDYNLPNAAHAGMTNTTATFPASLVCDAITILSTNWNDNTYGDPNSGSYGTTGLNNRAAKNTTVNAAIIAGSVYTTGSAVGQFSGGVMNLTRLLENWSGQTLTLNSSLVNLYNSAKATNQFKNPGIYYNAPSRNFNFDQNFLTSTKLPPGTPTVSVISRSKWATVAINTIP
jgi:hypothetical protein